MKKRLMAAAAAALALVMAAPSPVLADEPSDDISYMGSTDATECGNDHGTAFHGDGLDDP